MVLSQEQDEVRAAIQRFATKVTGTREQRDELTSGGVEPHHPGLYRQMADLGWIGVGIDPAYGGSGGSLVDEMILFEEIARGMLPVSGVGPAHIIAGIYDKFGTEAQKRAALGAVSAGRIISISISEPEAGSDVANVSCRADADGDAFVLNGQKTWCSAAHHADGLLLLARTARGEKRHRGLTLFEVPTNAPGLSLRPIPTLAGREVNDVYLTDVRVPATAVVGEVDNAFRHVMAGLDGERLMCAAQGLGLAQRALDDAVAYVKARRQFGRSIGSFQALRHRVADLSTEIECARVLTYDAAARVSRGGDAATVARLASMAKLKTSETAKAVALEGMQMMGGYGYSTEFDMERLLRSSLVLPIFAGTNEIQREIISKSYGLDGVG